MIKSLIGCLPVTVHLEEGIILSSIMQYINCHVESHIFLVYILK